MMGSSLASDALPTPAQRLSTATEQVQTTWPEATNAKLLQAVLVELAAEAMVSDAAFARRVQTRYAAAASLPRGKVARGGARGRSPKPTTKVSDLLADLRPIRHIPNYEVTLDGLPDPYFLLEVFGSHQLARALQEYSLMAVREAAALVHQRNPSTKLAAKTSKQALIAYIVAHVVVDTPAPIGAS